MKKLERNLRAIALAIALPFTLVGCADSEMPESDEIQYNVSLPSSIEVTKGDIYKFSLSGNYAPSLSDYFILQGGDGVSYICPLVEISETEIKVRIDDGIIEGQYDVYIKRGNSKRHIGKIWVRFVDHLDFTPASDTSFYGKITSEGNPVPGVVVSDGKEVVVTDENGIYEIKSDKELGYVFISVPSGYEAESNGVVPSIYHLSKFRKDIAERADFVLHPTDCGDNYKIMFWGDMHLADRTGDLDQFTNFVNDVNGFISSCGNEKVYGVTLGDMTWDIYWDKNHYGLNEYLNTLNSSFNGFQVYHTMGNHDNEYKTHSDLAAEKLYTSIIAPSYYSFNIGKIHYVVLDDIDCSGYDGTTSRIYSEKINKTQLDWLEKDLRHVKKGSTIIVAMHAPLYKPIKGSQNFSYGIDGESAGRLIEILNGYKVHFVTGHSHLMFNVTPDCHIVGGKEIYEHNSGAVCGSWWWSGYLTPGVHLSPDGTPGGYGIWSVNGENLSYIYKATGYSDDYQFRTYDLNNISFSLSDVPDMPSELAENVKQEYLKYVDSYPANADNEVLLNIWNWNPSWTVEVTTENGESLPVKQVWAYDPLHIAALSVKRFNSSSLKSVPNFITEEYTHFFKVKAPDKDTDLNIKVCDEFGHIWIETMERPKKFTIIEYLSK